MSFLSTLKARLFPVRSRVVTKIKKAKIKKAIGMTLAVLSLCSLAIATPKVAPAHSSDTPLAPRFNFLDGDQEMLRAANLTDHGDWTDPINAKIGDRVAFLFYYHNGVLNSVAHDTKLRVDLPLDESNQLVAKSYLWSQETEAISDTIVGGNVVGLSGGTVNLPSSSRIQYVAGSTLWYPNIKGNESEAGRALPDGITTNSGVDIGSINGCWDFAGYVTFMADIKGQAQLVLDKTVAHPGESTWHSDIIANPGDSVAYHLGTRNDGDITATDVTLKDSLPTHMTYQNGTTYVYTKAHPEGVKLADTLFTTGVSIPNMVPGNDGIEYVTYRTTVDANIPAGPWVLVNVAKVFKAGVEQDQAQAVVNVTGIRGLVIEKTVSNGVSWVEQNTVKLDDTITYRIIVRNTGNTPVSSVVVRDVLPQFVTYNAGSTTVNSVAVADGIASSTGISLGNLAVGEQKEIHLSGVVHGCPPLGDFTLTNTGFVKATDVAEKSDTASSILHVTKVPTPVTPSIKL
jgi:uncharacterized repeat protein (TIGR01451 family)